MGLLPMLLMFVVLWFLLIRPQMKRAKEHKEMVEELQKGDEIVTAGGIVGRVTKLTERYVDGRDRAKVEISVQRGGHVQLLPKGTIKAL